ncbi:MAG: DUF721 domain-containing protein [Rickettsiales bacterium]|jgi:hypothetical protein|nr:DUF721 domain-containing protein [Rickettsiales bacterium]
MTSSEFDIEKPVAPAAARSRRGAVALADAIEGIVRKFAPKNGFAGADINREWTRICGAEIASMISPVRLDRRQGVLYARAASASLSSLAQYKAPLAVERINSYFGFSVVKRIKITAS